MELNWDLFKGECPAIENQYIVTTCYCRIKVVWGATKKNSTPRRAAWKNILKLSIFPPDKKKMLQAGSLDLHENFLFFLFPCRLFTVGHSTPLRCIISVVLGPLNRV